MPRQRRADWHQAASSALLAFSKFCGFGNIIVNHQVHLKRYTLAAATLLHRHTPLVGRIHSSYGRLLNIQTPGGRIFTLHGPGALQAPCAASLSEDIELLIEQLFPGDVVVQAQDAAYAAAVRLSAASAQLWDGRLLPLPAVTAAKLYAASEALAAWLSQNAPERGVVPCLPALYAPSARMVSPLHRRLSLALTQMISDGNVTPTSFVAMATQLIGLGEGLTPSGDDILVGFLAVLHAVGHASALLTPGVRSAFLAHLTRHTSDLSAEFLQCAVDGHFSEPMVRFIRALYSPDQRVWIAAAAKLALVGHSSGVDAMVGIVLGSRLAAFEMT